MQTKIEIFIFTLLPAIHEQKPGRWASIIMQLADNLAIAREGRWLIFHVQFFL